MATEEKGPEQEDIHSKDFQFVLKELLSAYQPILEEDLKRARVPERLKREAGSKSASCEDEIALVNRNFEKVATPDVAERLLPAAARELLGPIATRAQPAMVVNIPPSEAGREGDMPWLRHRLPLSIRAFIGGSLLPVLLLLSCVRGGADTTLELKNEFIEASENRATIEASYSIKFAHPKPKTPSPSKPSNDGDIHISGTAPEIGLLTVEILLFGGDNHDIAAARADQFDHAHRFSCRNPNQALSYVASARSGRALRRSSWIRLEGAACNPMRPRSVSASAGPTLRPGCSGGPSSRADAIRLPDPQLWLPRSRQCIDNENGGISNLNEQLPHHECRWQVGVTRTALVVEAGLNLVSRCPPKRVLLAHAPRDHVIGVHYRPS